jgi:hypothetical protein
MLEIVLIYVKLYETRKLGNCLVKKDVSYLRH